VISTTRDLGKISGAFRPDERTELMDFNCGRSCSAPERAAASSSLHFEGKGTKNAADPYVNLSPLRISVAVKGVEPGTEHRLGMVAGRCQQ